MYRFHIAEAAMGANRNEVQFAYLKLVGADGELQGVKASSEGKNPAHESAANTTNSNLGSKFYGTYERTGRDFFYELSAPAKLVSYELFTANDCPHRDPRDWTLSGGDSVEGEFTVLDTQVDQKCEARQASYGVIVFDNWPEQKDDKQR